MDREVCSVAEREHERGRLYSENREKQWIRERKREAKRDLRGGSEEEGMWARLKEKGRGIEIGRMGEGGRVGYIGEHRVAVVGVRAGVLGVGGRWYGFQEEREGEG